MSESTVKLSPGDELNFRTFQHSIMEKFGQEFIFDIHTNDEMYNHFFQIHKPDDLDNYLLRAHLSYFSTGERLLSSIRAFLNDKREFNNFDQILDFASGYGRLTRFLTSSFSTKNVSIAEIDHTAVDFLTSRLNVRGFKTSTEPEQFQCDEKFDLVIVVSLFSHLSIQYWDRWFDRLLDLLNPGGYLLITTHNLQLIEHLDLKTLEKIRVSDDFYFHHANETKERLDTSYYGSTYVSEDFLRKRALLRNLEFHFSLKGLGGHQDIACFVKR